MCGFTGQIGSDNFIKLKKHLLEHRGPDSYGEYIDPINKLYFQHNRLKIIDLDDRSNQPFIDDNTGDILLYNGEVYNYNEIKSEFDQDSFKTNSDTEVVLKSLQRWGEGALDKFNGMFALAWWNNSEKTLYLIRDRFGVKPLYYVLLGDGGLGFSSEIKGLNNFININQPNEKIWSTYLTYGIYEHSEDTFWEGVKKLPQSSILKFTKKNISIKNWYNLKERVHLKLENEKLRTDASVLNELEFLLRDSIRLRNISDVPVGVCLSGGVDSSLLFSLMKGYKKGDMFNTFTFYTGNDKYDETYWVKQLTLNQKVNSRFNILTTDEIPDLAKRMFEFQEEPYGGLPTLGMSKVYEDARSNGIITLLDGNGLDEAWGGYDYYQNVERINNKYIGVQGSMSSPVRPSALTKDFIIHNEPNFLQNTSGNILSIQLRDILKTKITRAMRFADRASMMHSIELREPFLDYRLVELGLSQPIHRKIHNKLGKWYPRKIAGKIMPMEVGYAPKRPVQTPQREWFKAELKDWVYDMVSLAVNEYNGIWLDKKEVYNELDNYMKKDIDNSFFIWQWISIGLMIEYLSSKK